MLVHADARVTLVDCGSMQVRDWKTGMLFLCEVGRDEFEAPERVALVEVADHAARVVQHVGGRGGVGRAADW